MSVPQFSIVTPSFRQSEWLRLCIASVADQGVPLEHIVQDAGSDDGTLDWLLSDRRVLAFVEKDNGMYDAVNRGFGRARGQYLAYLNCDEQYLPGALAVVARFFEAHPTVDVVFGDVIVVDADGRYLCHRRMVTPKLYHTWVCHLATLSCATFIRRRVVAEYGLVFDPQWRAGADGFWMVELLKRGLKMATLHTFTSVFTWTGANMSSSPQAVYEAECLRRSAPVLARLGRPLLVMHHRLRRLLAGAYWQKPFDYEIYTRASPERRVRFHVSKPTWRWPRTAGE